jgi:hypothetical protein
VGSLLKGHPILGVNGSAARLNLFPVEPGITWVMFGGKPSDEDFLIEALERTPDSVVVWAPGEHTIDRRLELPRLTDAVQRLYQPSARFGVIQVWERKPSVTSQVP